MRVGGRGGASSGWADTSVSWQRRVQRGGSGGRSGGVWSERSDRAQRKQSWTQMVRLPCVRNTGSSDSQEGMARLRRDKLGASVRAVRRVRGRVGVGRRRRRWM